MSREGSKSHAKKASCYLSGLAQESAPQAGAVGMNVHSLSGPRMRGCCGQLPGMGTCTQTCLKARLLGRPTAEELEMLWLLVYNPASLCLGTSVVVVGGSG